MITNLQKGKYMIISIVQEADDICHYIARNSKKQTFIVNEIRNITLINKWLPLLSKFVSDGQITCFTENSYLYILAHFYDFENAEVYFNINNIALKNKLEMIKEMTFRLIEYAAFPNMILDSILQPENICVSRGELCFNCFIYGDSENLSAFNQYSNVLRCLLSKEDIQKLPYINIVFQKLRNSVYTDFMQVYLDVQQLVQSSETKTNIIEKAKKLYQKYKSWLKITAAATIIILTVIVIYNTFVESATDSTKSTFTDIDHIGTVTISSNDNDDYREVRIQ